MAVVLDTSLAWAFLTPRDRHHAQARTVMRELAEGRHGAVLTNDYIYAETMALAARFGARQAEAADAFFLGEDALVQLARVDARTFEQARALLLAQPPRGLTLTDWSVVAMAQRYKAGAVGTFDAELGRAFGRALP
jgi:predicted nucleic acid-binding protein